MRRIFKKTKDSILSLLSWIVYAFAFIHKHWILSHPPQQFAVPIIIVGNITLGGTGKTPLVCALVEALQQKGYRPGVVSRGYKAKKSSCHPQAVSLAGITQTAEHVGDEPLLIFKKTGVPVVICKNRPRAVAHLLENFSDINLIISDDGLQHYRLHRDIEIALVGRASGFFREPKSRLDSVDFVINNQELTRKLDPIIRSLSGPEQTALLSDFKSQAVYALAGIAHPTDFFDSLKQLNLNLEIIEVSYSDHYSYTLSDVQKIIHYAKQAPVFITEKDAVKLVAWTNELSAGLHPIWVVSLVTELPYGLVDKLVEKLLLIN